MLKIKLLKNILILITLLQCNYAKALTDSQIAVQQICYFSKEAKEVFIVWGINNWKLQNEELRPEGTFLKGNSLFTPMKSKNGVFFINLKMLPKTQIDYKFWITRDSSDKNVDVWDTNNPFQQGYHTIVLTDNSILIKSSYYKNKVDQGTAPENYNSINYSRKLLIGEKKTPLTNQKIVLKDPLSAKTVTVLTDKYGDFMFKNLNPNFAYKIEIPVDTILLKKPKRRDDSKISLNISFKPSEFPELALYKNVIFEMGDENTNFDKSYYSVIWDSITLLEGPKKGDNYKIILRKAGKKTEFIIYPVFDAANYEIALKEYEEKIISYRSLLKGEKLYMARNDGTIIKNFQKAKNYFTYELLPFELVSLLEEKEIDPEFSLSNFISSTKSELVVTEDIYYKPNSSDIEISSGFKLNKIVGLMKKNSTLKLTISSHTDARGNDLSNMALSQKRAQKVMEYFISKGIEKSRLKAEGYGETQIKNKCRNGVACSDSEHKVNRRTEFKFIKQKNLPDLQVTNREK